MPSPSTNPSSFDADILIVGAGPTGLTLAASLTSRGVRTMLIDRQAEGDNTSRAAVIHARTLEVLEPLGDVTSTLVARGLAVQRFTIRDRDRVLVPIGFGELPTRYPFTLMLPQVETERVLLDQLHALGGTVQRPRTLVSLAQDAHGATATLDDGSRVRARYVVGADGMHSAVRASVGIAFEGDAYDESFSLADVRLEGGVPHEEVILYFSPAGLVVVAPLPGGAHRIVATVDDAPAQPGIEFVQSLLDARGPQREPVQVREVLWGSRFRVHHRIAERYRDGRVLLAGDAAHVHSPAGGQGMNAGILDAMVLADALVQAMTGDQNALDAYGRTRRQAAERVVALAHRLTRLATLPAALRGVRNALLATAARAQRVRERLAWQLSGLVYR